VKYITKVTNWNKDKAALSDIRKKVFIEEQKVPEELEWDEFDEQCIHVLVTDDQNKPIATGRIKPDGHIGRMAVIKDYRNTGIGTEILKELIQSAQNKHLTKVYLHAQTTAIPFYEKQGFKTCSEEFMDANIPHMTMEKQL